MQHSFKFAGAGKNSAPESSRPDIESPAISPKVDYDLPEDPKRWNSIALVGEAPGAEEVKQGHPFVGRSGQLLNKILDQAGIKRADSLVANVFRFQPPGNKVDHFFISRRAATSAGIGIAEDLGPFGSVFCRSEFAPEIAALTATLQKLKPKIIVSLGRTPLWALTGENGLLEKVGKALPCRLIPGVSIVPTYHPSFILRGNWALQDKWLQHLATAKSKIQ